MGVQLRLRRRRQLLGAAFCIADDNRSLGDRTRQYLMDLVRLDTSNPPGNETRIYQIRNEILLVLVVKRSSRCFQPRWQ